MIFAHVQNVLYDHRRRRIVPQHKRSTMVAIGYSRPVTFVVGRGNFVCTGCSHD